ncbi:MAG: AN1-type zinc finger domain-containing protein [Candidatus Bathyarchaeia archaeon]
MKCQVCNQETVLPFRCPYCGGQFCSAHRLPENHACPRIDSARTQRQEQVMAPQSYNSYQYSYVFGQQPFKRKRRISFSPKELKHIIVAAVLVIGIGFSIGLYGRYFGGFNFEWTLDLMAIFAVIMTASFLSHEIAHKVMAQRKGLWAEFRLTTWGAVLTFVSIFLPFRMIAPGAMMIAGSPNGDEIVKISIVGPITNIIFSTGLLGFAFALLPSASAYALMLFFAAYINAFMAIFNLIPFGILDGYKIFSFNKKAWALAFILALIPTIIAVIYTF